MPHLLFGASKAADWRSAGSGTFVAVDGRLESVPGADAGLYWCTHPTPPDFILRLEWLRWRHADASGVLVRFRAPGERADDNPAAAAGCDGFEVRIDEVGPPGATAMHRTGAIYNEPAQLLTPRTPHPPAQWNQFEIVVRGQLYIVRLNGQQTTSFENPDPRRGRPSESGDARYIGLQLSPGSRVAFRNISIETL